MTNTIVCKTCGKVFQFKSHLKRHLSYSRACAGEPVVSYTSRPIGPTMIFDSAPISMWGSPASATAPIYPTYTWAVPSTTSSF